MSWTREGGLRIPLLARQAWLPMRIRYWFTGRWTQAEIEAVHLAAKRRREAFGLEDDAR